MTLVRINWQWVTDTLERAAKSAAQGALTVLSGNALSVWNLDWQAALGIGLGSAAFSLLTSIASTPFGQTGTPSLLPEPKPAPLPAPLPGPWTGTTRDV